MSGDTLNIDQPDVGTAVGASAGDQSPRLSLRTQYTKDLSFENLMAPDSLSTILERPYGDTSITVLIRKLGENDYEVQLEFSITASHNGESAFVVELIYAGVFILRGFEGEAERRTLWVRCPSLLFPFARRIIADVVQDGGFPPLMLMPVNFLRMYQQRVTEIAAEREPDNNSADNDRVL